MNTETVLTGTARVTNFCAVPGYTFSPCQSSVSWDGEDEHCSVDLSPLEKPGNSISPKDNNKSFITVSDISLRTKPSRLPPPSRPPPALVVENREFDRPNSKLKPSKINAFDRVADDSASLFFDVEVDENKNAKVKYGETSVPVPGDVAWKEETKYFEVFEKNISRQGFDMVEDYNTSTRLMNRDSYRHRRMLECDVFNQKEDSMKLKVTKEAPKWDEESNQLEMTTDHCERGHKQQQEMQNTRLIGQKGFQENVKLSKLADFDTTIPENFLQLGDSEKLEIKHIDETVEGRKESKCNVTAGEEPTRMDIQKRSVDAQVIKQSSGEDKQNILREECQRSHEDVKGAETRERIKKTTEREGAEKQHNGVTGNEKESKLKVTHELNENGVILKEANVESVNKPCIAAAHEKNVLTFREALQQVRNEKEIKLIHNKREVSEDRNRDASKTKHNDAAEYEELEIEWNGHAREVKWDLDGHVLLEGDQLKVFDGGCELNEMTKNEVLGKHDTVQMRELSQAAFSYEGNRCSRNEANNIVYESEAGKDDTLVKGNCSKISKNKDELQDGNTHTHSAVNNAMEFLCLHNQMRDSNNCAYGMGVSSDLTEKKSSEVEESHEPEKIGSSKDDGGQKMKTQFISKRVDTVIRESLVKGGKVDDASSVLLENSNSQKIERKDKNIKDSIAAKDRTVEERVRRQSELENEQMRKVEEEREREREREKDRMAVNKAAVEARERSYIEARERAERANAEVRQRAMTGARERLDKTSMDARIRVERAAVERANAEARHRAAEKSMAQNGLPYSSSLPHFVSEGESPQRCKARLERYKRTAERAANALAEKNSRDLLAQRETEERNRVAESLDAELKRWSSGKERNLRALLSTLQYILGPDSGWQPVPLTEVITTAAVKKAYRKATLFVHPDKLQQRGATIQQKYICEKVFDLLKEAWNKFNSEER
ncbi:hypothetical protein ABFX02_12G001600 [Erythranthe guttata]